MIYGIFKASAERSARKSPPTQQSEALTLKDIALKMTPAVLRGFARHTVQGNTQNKETMITAEPSSKAHGIIVFGLFDHQLQAIYDYQDVDEGLTRGVAEITFRTMRGGC